MSTSFTPHVRGNHSYAELLDFASEGKDVPAHWLAEEFAKEQAAEQHAQACATIAADLKAREDAHAANIKAKHDKYLPTLRGRLAELDALCDAETPAREAAREAVAAYLKAARATAAKYNEIARIVRDEFGDTVKDQDGNPLPGQTGLDNMRQPLIEGERLRGVARPEPWNDKTFQNPYFY